MKYTLTAIAFAACLLATSALAHGPRCPASSAEGWRQFATEEACMYYRTADDRGFWFEFRPLLPRDADGLMIYPAYRLWVCNRVGATNEPGSPNYCIAPAYTDEVGPSGYTEVDGLRRWVRAVHHDLFTIRKTGGIRARRVQPQPRWHLEQNILPPLLACLEADLDMVMGENMDIDQVFLNQGGEPWCKEVLDALRGPDLPGYPLRSPWGDSPATELSTSDR